MVDITGKPEVYREAVAEGSIYLKEETIRAIVDRKVKKGDVFEVSRVAAIQAVKGTPRILPLCHPIRITSVEVSFSVSKDHVKVSVRVKAQEKTGVEMEALTGVMAALLNIWDMVKYLEKDETGNYPTTRIEGVKVVSKVKGDA